MNNKFRTFANIINVSHYDVDINGISAPFSENGLFKILCCEMV